MFDKNTDEIMKGWIKKMAKYICNPVNMNYPTNIDLAGRRPGLGYGMVPVPHRGTGDTTIVLFKGRYYLNGSFDGFWYSDDLVHWEHESGAGLNVMRGAAADFCQVGDWLYQCASDREKSSFYRTKDPMSREFEFVSEPFGFWDPCLFKDDDGRVYLYWGCSNVEPIYGIEMNPETMEPIGETQILFQGDPDHHGFERNGWNNDPKVGMLRPGETDAPGLDYYAPWIEGPYMNKHDGKYYLQYACPATELPVYCDGYYVSDKPLGPFTFSPNSPFSTKHGGFYCGAGHGSSFEDKYGNWWHASTMIGSTNFSSRKMGIFPVGFDKDGIMFCDQDFGDYPHIMPEGKVDPNSTFTGWMLLSYKKPVKASSTVEGLKPEYICDETSRTHWAAAVRRPGEWIEMDLEKVVDVRAIQLNFCDHDLQNLFSIPNIHFTVLPKEEQRVYHRWILEGSCDGENWEVICDKSKADSNLSNDFLVFEEGKQVRYLKLTSCEMPFYGNFAMIGLRVFGHSTDAAPAKVEGAKADRCKEDPCTIKFSWNKSAGADGYNVRWGIAADKLYHSTMVYGEEELLLHCFNDGVPYFFQVDAFNGGGITAGDCKAAE